MRVNAMVQFYNRPTIISEYSGVTGERYLSLPMAFAIPPAVGHLVQAPNDDLAKASQYYVISLVVHEPGGRTVVCVFPAGNI